MKLPPAPTLSAGERTAADLCAPGSIEERRSRVVVDGRASRVLALDAYPRAVAANWLEPLIDGEDPIDLSFHIEPLPKHEVTRMLNHKRVMLESTLSADARAGRLRSNELTVAIEDVERMAESVERQIERAASVSVYIRVYGDSDAKLDEAEGRVRGALGGLLARARTLLWEQSPGLVACLPAVIDRPARTRNLDTTSITTMLPLGSSRIGDDGGILYGTHALSGALVTLDPFGRENANKIVFARSGAGKSFFCKVEAMRALQAGISYLVIDPESEYTPLCDWLGGRRVALSGATPHSINPFDMPPAAAGESDAFSEHVLSVLGLLAIMVGDDGATLTPLERAALDAAIVETYRRAGIDRDPATHARPAPLLRDLVGVIAEGGDPHQLALRLRRYTDGSLARLFSEPTSVDINHPFVVFDIAGVQPDVRTLATYLIAQHVWREVRARPVPRLLLVDEAWKLLERSDSASFLASMARQARKHFLGLITSTQDVRDFLSSDAGQTVAANSAVKVLMRQDTTVAPQVAEAFGLTEAEEHFLTNAGVGRALLLAGVEHAPLVIEASPLEYQLATTDPEDIRSGRAAASAGPTP